MTVTIINWALDAVGPGEAGRTGMQSCSAKPGFRYQNFQNRGFGRELAGRPETGVSVLGNLETGVSVVRKSETGDSVSETGVSVDTWRAV